MEELFKKQKKIRFSGAGASHKNEAAEQAINMVVTISRTMLMHATLICPKYTFPPIFVQWKWVILYGSTIRFLICSLYYPLLKYSQGQGLKQFQKPLATVMFGVVQHMF